MKAALAPVREHDHAAAVECSLHEMPFAWDRSAGAVDRPRPNDRGPQLFLTQQDPFDGGLLRRVVLVPGWHRRLRLADRSMEARELVRRLRLVERPAAIVGVDGATRDDDDRTEAISK